ncbi:hypothetical protein NDU88_003510 [Pleurodeles waltl]|uniref:Uncharacterized protein n=1 Tax=Pleurodeles waltl TaxID=8319 RepID=A0AAV7Q967_PLEWA|nr:hypothetical protein NDU88_003510 [Pleurodeles waltl]
MVPSSGPGASVPQQGKCSTDGASLRQAQAIRCRAVAGYLLRLPDPTNRNRPSRRLGSPTLDLGCSITGGTQPICTRRCAPCNPGRSSGSSPLACSSVRAVLNRPQAPRTAFSMCGAVHQSVGVRWAAEEDAMQWVKIKQDY